MSFPIRRFAVLLLISAILWGCGGLGGKQKASSQPGSITSSAVPSTASSKNSSSMQSEGISQLKQKIDAYLISNQPADTAGVSVLVVKNGVLAYSGGKGMADISSSVAIASDTGFRLASVSKIFTALAIMQLVEKGALKVTDSLLDFIPELPQSWRNITIEHLLTHTSGIYDIINDGWHPEILNAMTHSKLISYLINHPALEFEPGTRHDYSNTGFMLLATVVERKSGLSFPDYMQQNIFGPANMHGSYINDENQEIKYGDALNYARLRTYYGITTFFKGSMAQVSSRDDFFNFFAAMRDNKLVSAKTLAAMSRPHVTARGITAPNGYGFFIVDNYLAHDGQWDGFETEFMMSKSQNIDFVIITNSGSAGRGHIDAIRNIIFSTAF